MTGSHDQDARRTPADFGAEYWESRYHRHDVHADRQPNPQLVAEVDQLSPGTALDAGCGEGANAVWLASGGWQVTAVDIAELALSRGREHAQTLGAELGIDIESRIDWVRADLTTWTPPEGRFDLVTAHYVHPLGGFTTLVPRLGDAVAPGGTLLLVSHDPSDPHPLTHTTSATGQTPQELAASLDQNQWAVEVAESRQRPSPDSTGHDIAIQDAVLRARKLQ